MKYNGRPRKYETPEEMQVIIEDYFEECYKEKEVPTVTGLGFVLNMTRKEMLEYENAIEKGTLKNCSYDMKVKFRNTLKRAKQYIESCQQQCLYSKDKVTGAIFSLKNNWGWVDRVEQVVENKEIIIDIEE